MNVVCPLSLWRETWGWTWMIMFSDYDTTNAIATTITQNNNNGTADLIPYSADEEQVGGGARSLFFFVSLACWIGKQETRRLEYFLIFFCFYLAR